MKAGDFPSGSDGKESASNAGNPVSITGSGRSPGEGGGYPLQCSCLENSMDRGAWWATVHTVTRNRTRLVKAQDPGTLEEKTMSLGEKRCTEQVAFSECPRGPSGSGKRLYFPWGRNFSGDVFPCFLFFSCLSSISLILSSFSPSLLSPKYMIYIIYMFDHVYMTM